jgi:mannose-6-phosphate isomerase-like protein (cupin superfamily)
VSPCTRLGSIIWSRPNTPSNARCSSLRSPPGFNTGAHYHTKIEEIFYVLEGELDLRCGERTVRGGPGTCVFVPPGAAHAFGNSGSKSGRMLLITAPPGHEKYFDELRDLIAKGGKPDPDALAKLRRKVRHSPARNTNTGLKLIQTRQSRRRSTHQGDSSSKAPLRMGDYHE